MKREVRDALVRPLRESFPQYQWTIEPKVNKFVVYRIGKDGKRVVAASHPHTVTAVSQALLNQSVL
jgi:hypothetical protein